MNRVLYSLFCLLLFGCDSLRKEVSPDRLNREAAKLVVTGFLSPQDTVLAVKVTRSQPVLGEEVGFNYAGINVTDAIVSLSEGGKSVMLRYNSQGNYYSANRNQLPVIVGRTYTLTVQTPNGEQAISTCTIPEAINLSSVTFDSLTTNDFGREVKRYFVRGRWQDLPGQINYYQLMGVFRFTFPCVGCQNNPNYPQSEQFTTLSFDQNNNGLQTDRGTEGKEMISDRAFFGSYYFGNVPASGFGGQYKSASLTVDLLSTDQAYYQYQDAVARQSQVVGNPFSEPVPIPTNIRGAFGCFAGYNRSTVVMRIK